MFDLEVYFIKPVVTNMLAALTFYHLHLHQEHFITR